MSISNMDPIDELFARKTLEAQNIIVHRQKHHNDTTTQDVPFEVNKVLYQIGQETQRRAKLLKRKPQ